MIIDKAKDRISSSYPSFLLLKIRTVFPVFFTVVSEIFNNDICLMKFNENPQACHFKLGYS